MSTTTAGLARRWFEEVWNERRSGAIDELLAPDCHGSMQGVGEVRGADEFRRRRDETLEALPDLAFTLDDVLAEGPKAAVRWTARATHRGGFGAPATGRSVEIHGLIFMEFADGKLLRAWDAWNHDGLVRLLLAPEGGDIVV